MNDGEREIDITAMQDSDTNAPGNRQRADDGASDSSSGSEEQRNASSTSRSADSRINADDLEPSMNAWRNEEYGEVM
ncbi:MAG: hypothetical protein JWL61_3683 [Gemmatimonadetes bacterium]|nr:hypothetical protein [Gemmatimonadota bacterium]